MAGIGRLLELDNPRRTGGGRPWRIVIGSAAMSSGKRLISGYIFRAMGTDSRVEPSLMGSSLTARSMRVGVVTVVVAASAGSGKADCADWREDWLAARVRKRDKIDGMSYFQM